MHMQGVKLDPAAESRAGNPSPRLQQKAFVTTSPPLLFNPPPLQCWYQRAAALAGRPADNQGVLMQGQSLQGGGRQG